MGRSSCCVVCVCMWTNLCVSISHSDGSFLLLCCVCVCTWSRLCASVSHSDLVILLVVLGVSVCGPVYALVYPIVAVRSSCCVVLCVSVCGPVCALVYPTVMGRSSCFVCLYVVSSML
jgi:hypothetical protein